MHDFTARCLGKNPNARSTPGDLLKHPFLERARDSTYLSHRLLGAAPQSQLRSAMSFKQSSDGTPHASEVTAGARSSPAHRLHGRACNAEPCKKLKMT